MAPSEPKKEKKERTLTGLHVRKNLRRMASGGSSRKDEEAANEDLLRADRAEAAAAAADAWLCEARLAHCLLYTSPSPRDQRGSRMPSSA